MGCNESIPETKSTPKAPTSNTQQDRPAQAEKSNEAANVNPSQPPPQNSPPTPPPAAPAEAPKEEPTPPPAEPPKVEMKPTELKPFPKTIGVKDEDTSAYGLLLCGTGESGKTTFTRQLRLRFWDGFTNEERLNFVNTIRGNLIEAMQTLIIWLERHNLEVDDENLANYVEEVLEMDPLEAEFNDEVADMLTQLWEDPSIEEAFQHRNETIIPDHMDYFYGKINEIAQDDYTPTDEDILKARIRTIGIDQVTFNCDGAYIRIYDVGGQKSERAKWEKCMKETEGVIYCVSFADFDKPMFEEQGTVRIKDALMIFEQLTHKEKFGNSPFFLLCNKFDAFSERIKNTNCFVEAYPKYQGNPHDPEECAKFLIDMFLDAAKPEQETRPIIEYKLVALDSQSVATTIDSICKYIRETYFESC